ncbi:MAG: DUF3990 domain-containing protein [Bacteroidetes bacterium]|nr:DUF3990 domain-containing protein [Bacteroidota bacterium]
MKIYHGSTSVIETPEIIDSQRFLDFGRGFYTTTNQVQAEKWAIIKQKRRGGNSKSIVSVYEIDDDLADSKKFETKKFPKADSEWLNFVISNRKGEIFHNYDIVIGAVANDKLYATLSLFESGILSLKETISRLKVHKLFDQISFHSQIVLKELVFVECYNLTSTKVG